MATGVVELAALLGGGIVVLVLAFLLGRRRLSTPGEPGGSGDTDPGGDADDPTTDPGGEPPPSTVPPARSRYETTTFATPLVEVSITASRALQNRRGDVPAQVVARHLHRAFDQGEINHQIEVHDAPVVPPAEGTVGSGTPVWWRDTGSEVTAPASHANLLLVDAPGGGGTYGPWCVVGTGGIDADVAAQEARTDGIGAGVFAALHECGHSLGLAHDLDPETPGKQHTGYGWNEDGRWHLTPMNVDHGVTNNCGVDVEPRRHDAVTYHLSYTDCTVEHIVAGLDGDSP